MRLLLTFTALAVLVSGVAAWWSGGSDDIAEAVPPTAPPAQVTPGAIASQDDPQPSSAPSSSSSSPTTGGGTIPVPKSGPGTFKGGTGNGTTAGHGTIRTYKIQVEDGITLSADQVATDVAAILANPRSWARDGKHGFRQVSSGSADLVIRIATPDTADQLCLEAIHMDTENELNCEVPGGVVVNLRRWMLGSPTFTGPISDYRALIINHEVGHSLGHGHEGCPGRGKPAPAMMQQIKGLNGCKPNAWPYDGQGHYLGGPPVT
ncbi:DUF3152 domain-containing protein [Streptomyces sp. H10-C2]|uniref:DUF3152 domain-containing protein n=1 Tax=unclassified Streptomyces TaxID=2593676 RepID=UPI0024B9E7AD|nr:MULTISPECIES: DUF3152 domain-containing protein [unclassified Streptomyces]MDJ0340394.1 DUF3152 domain-containing protein [Streptomyces sp. PH10-H1]MDJ0368158.1 DUF3152 domain-containing protein [Streptomyces sp. H10-C2]